MKRKRLLITLLGIVVLLVSSNSFALDLWGRVTNAGGSGIAGANIIISDPNFGPQAQVTANSDGFYVWSNGGYCGYKIVTATAEEYANASKNVWDNSCPTCPPECPDDNGDGIPDNCRSCKNSIRADFSLQSGTSDRDADGEYDYEDNCPTTPNGPRMGTCNSGSKRGRSCSSQIVGVCGCAAHLLPCDMFQTDSNGNGIGDVCEYGGSSQEAVKEAHLFMKTQSMNPEVIRTAWNIFFYLHNKGTYGSWEELIAGLTNGDDVYCGDCYTHDFDDDGIGDEWEDHGIPDGLTFADYYAGFLKAMVCCAEKWQKED